MSRSDRTPLDQSGALPMSPSEYLEGHPDNPTSALPASPTTPRRVQPPFGPWLPGVPETERHAALRTLAALIAVYCGSSHVAVTALRRAEIDITASDQALAEFDRLPAKQRRHVLTTYAMVMSPSLLRGA